VPFVATSEVEMFTSKLDSQPLRSMLLLH